MAERPYRHICLPSMVSSESESNRLNRYAISSKGIGDALQRSAAALAQAGNDLNESIGLIVGGNAVVQDPDVVGKKICPAA